MNENGFLSKIKKCSKCGLPKSLDLFYPKKKGLYGVDSRCKECVLLSKKLRYEKSKRKERGVVEIDDQDFFDLRIETIAIMRKHLELRCHPESES